MKAWFSIILIALWPIINYVQLNYDKINQLNHIVILTACSILISLITVSIARSVTKTPVTRWVPILFIATLLFYSYSESIEFIGQISPTFIKASYVWVLLYALLGYVAYRLSKYSVVQTIAPIVLYVMVAIPVTQIAYDYSKTWTTPKEALAQTNADYAFKSKPNIYYVLLDGYARQDTLKDTLNYNNEPFLKELESMGFSVSRDAHSNYHFTGASLSATMNMNYHQKNQNGEFPYGQMHNALKGDNPVRKILSNNGYEIINIPAHWHQMDCYGFEDVCIKSNNVEIFESYLSSTPLRFVRFEKNYVEPIRLKETLNLKTSSPKFVFAHLAQVHDAIYNEDGSITPLKHPIYSNPTNGTKYLSSVKFINSQLLTTMQSLIENDPNCIIIIQADHGPTFVGNQENTNPDYWLTHTEDYRLKTKQEQEYMYGILSAVYVSPHLEKMKSVRDYFNKPYSLVNTFRTVFAGLSGQEPNLLVDKMQFLNFNQSTNTYREVELPKPSN